MITGFWQWERPTEYHFKTFIYGAVCNQTITKIGRCILSEFLIPSVEMLLLMPGTFPLKLFCYMSKLMEIIFTFFSKLAVIPYMAVHTTYTWFISQTLHTEKNIARKGWGRDLRILATSSGYSTHVPRFADVALIIASRKHFPHIPCRFWAKSWRHRI